MISLVLAMEGSAPPDNLPSFLIWMVEQATGKTTLTRIGLFVFGWYFFVTFAVVTLRRLNEGVQSASEAISRTFRQPVNLAKDLLAGVASTAILLLGALWGLATFWVATKWGSYFAGDPEGAGPMGGMFPLNLASVMYLTIAASNVLLSLWVGLGHGDNADSAVNSGFLSGIWFFPAIIMLPTIAAGLFDVILGPPPQHFWAWLLIFLFHFGGWFTLPVVWMSIRGLVKLRREDRVRSQMSRMTDAAAERAVAEMRRSWEGQEPQA